MDDTVKNNTKRRELWLIVAILVIAGGFYARNWYISRHPAVIVEVTVDGAVVKKLKLKKNTTETIEGHNGGTNQLVVQDGSIYIAEATCPDKVCIHQGKISRNGEMIICLPNMMIAKIVGE